jgi:hypothetical protein
VLASSEVGDGWIHHKRSRKHKSPRETKCHPSIYSQKNTGYLLNKEKDHVAENNIAESSNLSRETKVQTENLQTENLQTENYKMRSEILPRTLEGPVDSKNLQRKRSNVSSGEMHDRPEIMEEISHPTMEIIDVYKSKHNNYQRMREPHNVTGFIVNVHDATNFDIDLEIPTELHDKYRDVISNQYTYQDLGYDFLENPDLNRTSQITPCIGTTYRCRLRGVGINMSSHMHTWKSNQMCVEIKQLIDRTDGWVTCVLSDIDVYQRLLVDIVINTCQGPINLGDYLLTRASEEDHPIFYPYSGKRDRIKHPSSP